MTDPSDDQRDEASAEIDSSQAAGVPRWVKVFGAIALVLAVLFVVLQLASGGKHGPGRHVSVDKIGSYTPPPSVTETYA